MLLKVTLKSDATFARGDGVAGLVDAEVEHDAYGLPVMRGRALKGLLVEECSNTLFALERLTTGLASSRLDSMHQAARCLFGGPGSRPEDQAQMRVGDALMPAPLREAIRADVRSGRLSAEDVLESLTSVRRQTAMEPDGVPARGSLRSTRVLLRNTELTAPVTFGKPPDADSQALLAACVRSLRRAGAGRNRGRGCLKAELVDDAGTPVTDTLVALFRTRVEGEGP